jgi:UDP-N-acetylglucosamine 2-epimerase (non-hydrolysing)
MFVTEASGVRNLRLEGVPASRIFFTGNVMIDTLLRFRDRVRESGILARQHVASRSYAAVTLHRPANVDDLAKLKGLAKMLTRLAKAIAVIFPVHPRTCARLEVLGLEAPGLHLIAPLGYLDFLRLMSGARLVLTDSDGIQEETTILGVPCVILRENTERPVTIEMGTNRLAGVDPVKAYAAALEVLNAPWLETRGPELFDGRASSRIVGVLERNPGG